MKTLTTIFLLLAVFFNNNVFSQTKEETEQWLNDYGSKILFESQIVNGTKSESTRLRFKGYDGEYLNFSNDFGKYDDKNGKMDYYMESKLRVLPKDILYQEISLFGEKNFDEVERNISLWKFILKAKSGTVLASEKLTNGDTGVTTSFDNGTLEQDSKKSQIVFLFEKEKQKDAIRFFKAILHFAKLNGAKDLPTVNKTIFD